ncbi:hypothetical protein [Limnohabitans sp. MMS-10A-178]|uniref:hypothetical protein n=1 Tax=Limnohabitans sp. MMS-10A-178 TaxID=1835767 RepID=UPI001E5EFF58
MISETRLRIFQVLLHQALFEAGAEDVQLLEQVRERVRVRVASGEAARYEIIKADAEIITARERLQTAQLMVEQNKIQLNQLAAGQLPAKLAMGWFGWLTLRACTAFEISKSFNEVIH